MVIFYKLPVLPTREIGYPIDEIIETTDNKYEKVMQMTRKHLQYIKDYYIK